MCWWFMSKILWDLRTSIFHSKFSRGDIPPSVKKGEGKKGGILRHGFRGMDAPAVSRNLENKLSYTICETVAYT